MKTVKIRVSLPVELVWNYREFNRIVRPAPQILFMPTSSLHDLSKDIAKNGLQHPISLSVYNGKALVSDGNHRLTSYKVSNKAVIEVEVTYYDVEAATNFFLPMTLTRFRKINSQLAELLNVNLNGLRKAA